MPDNPTPAPAAPAAAPAAPTALAAIPEAAREAAKSIFHLSAPLLIDIGLVLLDWLGFRKQAKQIAELQAQILRLGQPAAAPATPGATAPTPTHPAQGSGIASGIFGFGQGDEAAMKRFMDAMDRFFLDAGTPDLPKKFRKLARQILKTDEQRERLRIVINRNPDFRDGVAGCITMVQICQTREAFVGYMKEKGILLESDEIVARATAQAAGAFRKTLNRIHAAENRRRRDLGF